MSKKSIRCEATTNPCHWWDDDKIEFPQCRNSASVNIDGVNMCMQHAGTIAIIKLINEGKAEKLETANPNGPLCSLHGDRWEKHVRS